MRSYIALLKLKEQVAKEIRESAESADEYEDLALDRVDELQKMKRVDQKEADWLYKKVLDVLESE